jgi:folylpolyglutamate synthase/dihydropteroate synthase
MATEFSVGQDIKGRHSVPASLVAELLGSQGGTCDIELDANAALMRVLETKQRTVVVSGSLYLVAKLRAAVIALST